MAQKDIKDTEEETTWAGLGMIRSEPDLEMKGIAASGERIVYMEEGCVKDHHIYND